MICPNCQTEHQEPQCPICAPFVRLLALSRQNRRQYAQRKAGERVDIAKREINQPHKND